MLLGAAAVMLTAGAAGYRDVTGQYMTNPAFFPGWQGALTDVANGVGEVWCGAFNLYQVLPDMPAGEYVLSVNAFYRCGNNDFSKANQTGNPELNTAFIYANGNKQVVKGLFEGRETAPNGTGDANNAFSQGDYVNTLTFNHEGGDLTIGIANTGCYFDEWSAFDNFTLKSGDKDYTNLIKNADFSEGIDLTTKWDEEPNPEDPENPIKKYVETGHWNMMNSANSDKKPDVNCWGGVYRKTNASPYNFGQQVDLPAGKYRFSALTFLRYGGSGDYDGKIISCKGEWKLQDVPMSPKQWWEEKAYKEDDFIANAYLYASFEESKPTDLATAIELLEENMVYARVKGPWEICEGNYAIMPENETRGNAAGEQIVPAYEVKNVMPWWEDSGKERESSAAFVNEPEKWRQYVEFELAAPAKVWVGLAKDQNNPAQYWQPFADFKLEKFDGEDAVEAINAANGVVEYYNIQGVRVANPDNGIFIVREGNKVSKKVIR